jgi:hypothetical protein
VIDNGRLVTWADVNITQSLVDGDLPIPSVTWSGDGWTLKTTAFAEGGRRPPSIYGRYDLTNTSDRPRTLTLALAARPFQVNGPSQFLTTPGGVAPIDGMTWQAHGVLPLVGGATVRPVVAPDRYVASTFDAGSDPQSLLASGRTSGPTVVDPTGLASGAFIYEVTLAPGETRTFGFMSPLTRSHLYFADTQGADDPAAFFSARQAETAAGWREKLDRFDITLPPEAQAGGGGDEGFAGPYADVAAGPDPAARHAQL